MGRSFLRNNIYVRLFLHRVVLLALGLFIGFALGRASAPTMTAQAAAVDCYDAKGTLVPDDFSKFGGTRTACAPGQTAKLHR